MFSCRSRVFTSSSVNPLLSPSADRVPKTVPANFRKPRFDCYRQHVILQQLARPQWAPSLVEGRSEHPILRLIIGSDRSPLNQKINNIFWQCKVGS